MSKEKTLAEQIEALPKTYASHHGEWGSVVKTQSSDLVISEHTFDDFLNAFISSEPISVVIKVGYNLRIIGSREELDEQKSAVPPFVIGDVPGERSVAFLARESTSKVELVVSSISKTENRHTEEIESWTVQGFQRGYYSYNYNAGGESTKTWYEIQFEKASPFAVARGEDHGKLTWKLINDK